jgi:transposase
MHQNHPKGYLRDRAQAVLLKNRFYSIEAIADILAMTPTTVRRVLLNYEQNHLVGLYRKVGSGRPNGLKKSQWEELFHWVESGPKALEYRFAIWTTRSLRYQIYKRFNRWYSREWIRQILHDPFRYSWTRAKKVYAYFSPKGREAFKQNLQRLLQQAYAQEIILLFEDETLIDLYGSVGYSWSPVGQTQQVPHPGKKKSVAVFGAVNPVSGQSHYRLEEAINQDTTLGFLKQLQAYYHKHQPGQKLVVVWDKHPGHTADRITHHVASTDLLELVPTPTQSPDLNPMERLWDWLEDQMIKNAFFQTVDEIKKAARHFFSYLGGVKERVIQLMGASQSRGLLLEIVPPLRV